LLDTQAKTDHNPGLKKGLLITSPYHLTITLSPHLT
jgi:hypothetical protein